MSVGEGGGYNQQEYSTPNAQGQAHSYEDIGLSPAEFQAGVTEVRAFVAEKRAENGDGINEAEVARRYIHQNVEKLRAGEKYQEEAINQYSSRLTSAWDTLVYDRYGKETQARVVQSLRSHGYHEQIQLGRPDAAMLDAIATALNIPHTPGEQTITIPSQIREAIDTKDSLPPAVSGMRLIRRIRVSDGREIPLSNHKAEHRPLNPGEIAHIDARTGKTWFIGPLSEAPQKKPE